MDKDITYCNRECCNYKCIRNKDHLKTDYAFYGDFRFCEEWKEKEDKRCI